jgi:DNA-binding transcriptional regulator YdaS (Cro superfamily)
MNDVTKRALDRAIAVAGGPTALARGVGVKTHAVVQQWRLNRVPAEHCPAIEGFTGVRCEELRPDVQWSVLRAPVLAVDEQPTA